MAWIAGLLVLIVVGTLLRRLLRLDRELTGRVRVLGALDTARLAVYQAIALEVETQAAIVGVSLNEALAERDADNHEIAWPLVQLSVGEWNRLAELLGALLKVLGKHMGSAREGVAFRGIVSHQFKSALMVNYVRMHELLDQLVFRSSLRFQLHLRVLRRAAEVLTADFRRRYRYAEHSGDRELWDQIDLYFHDFDLIAKEALLALRALLLSLPDDALAKIDSDVREIMRRGVRSATAPVNR